MPEETPAPYNGSYHTTTDIISLKDITEKGESDRSGFLFEAIWILGLIISLLPLFMLMFDFLSVNGRLTWAFFYSIFDSGEILWVVGAFISCFLMEIIISIKKLSKGHTFIVFLTLIIILLVLVISSWYTMLHFSQHGLYNSNVVFQISIVLIALTLLVSTFVKVFIRKDFEENKK